CIPTAVSKPSCCTKPQCSSSVWGWPTTCMSRRATWRWASNASSRSRGPWPPIRCSYCLMSRLPACATRKSRSSRRCLTSCARKLTDHIVVMDFGTKIAEGRPEEIQTHPAVLEAYLGGIDDDLDIEPAPAAQPSSAQPVTTSGPAAAVAERG